MFIIYVGKFIAPEGSILGKACWWRSNKAKTAPRLLGIYSTSFYCITSYDVMLCNWHMADKFNFGFQTQRFISSLNPKGKSELELHPIKFSFHSSLLQLKGCSTVHFSSES